MSCDVSSKLITLLNLLHVAYPFAHAKRTLRPTGALKGDETCINTEPLNPLIYIVSSIYMSALYEELRKSEMHLSSCIQDTLSSRARLAECVARAKVSCIQPIFLTVYEAPHMKIYEAPHMNFGELPRSSPGSTRSSPGSTRSSPGSTRSTGQQYFNSI